MFRKYLPVLNVWLIKAYKAVNIARRSAGGMNRIARSFGWEKNKIARKFRRKGKWLFIDHGGKEQTSLIWHTASRSVLLSFIFCFLLWWILSQTVIIYSLPSKTTSKVVLFPSKTTSNLIPFLFKSTSNLIPFLGRSSSKEYKFFEEWASFF